MPKKAFVLRKSKSGKFVFNLHAGNGQVVLTSEQYEDRAGALDRRHGSSLDSYNPAHSVSGTRPIQSMKTVSENPSSVAICCIPGSSSPVMSLTTPR